MDSGDLVRRFTWVDYLVLSSMLATSAGIGFYYGFIDKRRKGTEEFFMAGKAMGAFPVSMSLIASFISAIALIGIPTEIYQNGTLYWLLRSGCLIAAPTSAYLYFPVFWDLQVSSANEYLEKRFNRSVRQLGSILFILQTCIYMAIVVYAPALALAQVTGIHVYVSVMSVCFVCIFYTALGGMKAVLWTDVLQIMVMLASVLFIIVKGLVDQGGFAEVWSKAASGNRTELVDWSFDPRTRHSFWALVIGGYFLWLPQFCINQTQVQRYLCVKEKQLAIRAIWISGYGYVIAGLLCAFIGLLAYSHYVDCDPLSANLVDKADQIIPLYVMDSLGNWPGVPGLFVAGVFAGALSTVSSGINALAMLVMEDFIKGVFCIHISENGQTFMSKILSLIFGLITFGLVFVAEALGSILMMAYNLFGLVGGPSLGMFTLGMFIPSANNWGAFFGPLFGLALTGWINVGRQLAISRNEIFPAMLPVNTDCHFLNNTFLETTAININLTIELLDEVSDNGSTKSWVLEVYKMSYLWFTLIGFLSTMISGLIISALTGSRNIRTLNPKLLSPIIFKMNLFFPSLSEVGADLAEDNK